MQLKFPNTPLTTQDFTHAGGLTLYIRLFLETKLTILCSNIRREQFRGNILLLVLLLIMQR